MRENYDDSLRRVFVHEGGYTDHPDDPGGPTNWGITIHDARMYWKRDATAEDVRAMPKDVAKRIYRSKYWDAMRCDELPAGVDYAVFDFGVNSGISRSIKFLERIAGIEPDGRADDLLIRTVAHLPPKTVITELCNKRLVFLRGLSTWDTFGRGWGRRVEEVKSAALKMADATPAAPPAANAPGKTDRPDSAQKPITKSKTFWAQIGTVLTTILGAVTDWRVLAVLAVVALAVFVILERKKKIDISGWLK